MGKKQRERGEGRKDREMGIGGGERKLDQFIESWSKVLKKYSNKNQVLVFFLVYKRVSLENWQYSGPFLHFKDTFNRYFN